MYFILTIFYTPQQKTRRKHFFVFFHHDRRLVLTVMEGSVALLLLQDNESCDAWIEAVHSATSVKVGMLITEMFGIEQHNLLGGPAKSSSVNTEFDSASPSLSTLASASLFVVILMFGIDKYGRILGGLSDWSFWCSVTIRSFGSITLILWK